MSEIDPRDFGALEAKVDHLEKVVTSQSAKIDQLLELANHGKGALWAMIAVSSLLGAIATKLVSWLGFLPR